MRFIVKLSFDGGIDGVSNYKVLLSKKRSGVAFNVKHLLHLGVFLNCAYCLYSSSSFDGHCIIVRIITLMNLQSIRQLIINLRPPLPKDMHWYKSNKTRTLNTLVLVSFQ